MNRIKILLVIVLAVFFAQSLVANISITSKVDSTTLLMGKQMVLHLEVVKDTKQKGRLVNDPQLNAKGSNLVEGIEYIGLVRNDSTLLSENRIQINKDYLIQSFDSGLYTIPPFLYALGVDTFESSPLTIKVVPLLIDSVYEKINDYSPIEEVELKWYDKILNKAQENWPLIIFIVALLIGLILIIWLYRKRRRSGNKEEKRIPPYDLALIKLSELNSLKLCEKGREKEYYTKITEILREYLDNRFEINALEMTTAQIIDAVSKNEEASISKKYIEVVLEMADFVKFAKVRPLPEDNSRTFQAALQYVYDTKPAPKDENTGLGQNN